MKLNVRNLLIGLVIVIVLAVVLLRGDQLVELVETMKKGAAIPLIAALCTQLGKYFSQSFAYSFAFEAVDERMDPRSTLPLVFGTFFMNTIAPSLNLAGTTLVVDDARRRGIAPGRATSAALLMQITVDSGFATIMLIGFAILALTVGLSPLWFLLGLLVIALVSVMVLILVLGRKRPALVLRALRPIERLVDRVRARFKKAPLDPWVERAVGSFSDAAGLIAHNPKATAKTFGCSIVASLCELACFSLVGLGFGVTVPESLICGYVVATLFAMISITPQGVGVVEAAVVVAFTSFGVSGAAGLSIALVYRGIVFWMPFLIGAILIQTTKTFKHEAKKTVRASAKRDRMRNVEQQAKRLDEAKARDARPIVVADPRPVPAGEPVRPPRPEDAPGRTGDAQGGPSAEPVEPVAGSSARTSQGSVPRSPHGSGGPGER
ncbi:flippase-like domain-containing protein [Gordonibacter massiliensis (ex Traore et al. 2017)]|uniref:flippase-like domain-containing protein n=1 Tax=Gordonibacter massiliensis (ex Traore et al. 2017) TaxID=1841863 RepID=UPI00349FFA63